MTKYIPTAHNFIDMSGQRFGRLTVLELCEKTSSGRTMWLCRCNCGNVKKVDRQTLRKGHTSSCGCWHREDLGNRRRKHGKSDSALYAVWRSMNARCTLPTDTNYPKYGERGITVCDRWRHSFENFYADMGEPPSNKHSIDRIDNTLGYTPDNCRWATVLEQARNKRKTQTLTFNGETECIGIWADRLGMKHTTLYQRIYKLKWDVERALTTPVRKHVVIPLGTDASGITGEAHP